MNDESKLGARSGSLGDRASADSMCFRLACIELELILQSRGREMRRERLSLAFVLVAASGLG